MELGIPMQTIVDLLIKRAEAYLVILFGSYGKDLARDDSDVDIAYLGDNELDSYEVFLLAQKMAVLVGRDVDLLNLNMASTVMKAQIVSSGKVIYCSDEVRRARFYMSTYKEYATLNEQRAVVLRQIQRQGSIYGY
ncbi:MAG: type VII toxin-antitoxin system MntA family adenylyltransferase antitoxin [Negativicutes bacterium]